MQNAPHIRGEGTTDKPWIIKTVVFGRIGVGMTSLFRRLTEAVYDPQQEHLPQIGVEFQHRLLKSNTVKLQIWDFAYYGERTYHSFVPYFRNAKIVMIVGRTSTDHALENLRADF